MKKNTCCASRSGLLASHISKAPCTWLKWYAQIHDIKWLACLRDERGIQSTNEQPALPSRGHMTSFPKGFSRNQNLSLGHQIQQRPPPRISSYLRSASLFGFKNHYFRKRGSYSRMTDLCRCRMLFKDAVQCGPRPLGETEFLRVLCICALRVMMLSFFQSSFNRSSQHSLPLSIPKGLPVFLLRFSFSFQQGLAYLRMMSVQGGNSQEPLAVTSQSKSEPAC